MRSRLPVLGCGGWSSIEAVDPGVVDALATAFATAEPYHHVVIDGLFDPVLLHAIHRSFAEVPARSWGSSKHPLQRKNGTVADVVMPTIAQHYFDQLHSDPMRRFLSGVTGIADLLPDPSLQFAGMHEVPDGGRFELHVDFTHHPQTLRKNRIVVITYLNEGWSTDCGGALELWHWRPRRLASTVLPVFGRTIVMEVGPHNVHGHPHPVMAPDGRPRRSIAAYFYTDPDPAEVAGDNDTTGYVDRPDAGWGVRMLRFLHAAMPRCLAARVRGVLGRR